MWKKKYILCTLTVFCLHLKGSKFYFMAFLLFLDNSLKTSPNLTDKLCIFSTAQGKDKGNINVSLNYETEWDCTSNCNPQEWIFIPLVLHFQLIRNCDTWSYLYFGFQLPPISYVVENWIPDLHWRLGNDKCYHLPAVAILEDSGIMSKTCISCIG